MPNILEKKDFCRLYYSKKNKSYSVLNSMAFPKPDLELVSPICNTTDEIIGTSFPESDFDSISEVTLTSLGASLPVSDKLKESYRDKVFSSLFSTIPLHWTTNAHDELLVLSIDKDKKRHITKFFPIGDNIQCSFESQSIADRDDAYFLYIESTKEFLS